MTIFILQIYFFFNIYVDTDDTDIERSIKSEISLIYGFGDVQCIMATLDK